MYTPTRRSEGDPKKKKTRLFERVWNRCCPSNLYFYLFPLINISLLLIASHCISLSLSLCLFCGVIALTAPLFRIHKRAAVVVTICTANKEKRTPSTRA